jgi:hypothetical protein
MRRSGVNVLSADGNPLLGDSPGVFRRARGKSYQDSAIVNFGFVLPETLLRDSPVR